jgi:hypothetical protein
MLIHMAASREEGRRGMLIVEINGTTASSHPAARVFIEEGFAATGMGLQARIPGTGIAGRRGGGTSMANIKGGAAEPRPGETSDTEHGSVRSSNDRDQQLEREGIETEHNRGYDEAAKGSAGSNEEFEDIDPDSAESDVDRDDTIDEV